MGYKKTRLYTDISEHLSSKLKGFTFYINFIGFNRNISDNEEG